MAHQLEIDVAGEGPSGATLKVRGDLTGGGAEILRSAVRRIPRGGRIVIDLTGMRYLDVAGVALLCDLLCECMRGERRVAFVGIPRRYLKAMEQMGFAKMQAAPVESHP